MASDKTEKRVSKLVTLLKELFQLDQPDLDFGLYRIMHAKSAEVTQFLEKDLLPQVKSAFAHYKSADRAEIEKELNKVIGGLKDAGVDPDSAPKVIELRKRLETESVDMDALQADVFDHLFSFFRRYYSEGDFLSKRVYKPGVYAIPYEGEEVKLHWANADQYYIKSSEYLRDYAFRLRPEDEAKPMRVHFRLVDAEEGEHGNVKASEGKDRRFKLAETDPVALEGGELIVRFTYQADSTKQKDLNNAAEEAVLAMTNSELADWLRVLRAPHVRADGTESETSRLRVHLDRYTARNTFDYFIHKDLGGFLRRELDFYIKNEVMHLDDVESESAPRVEQYLSKIKVIRTIGAKIIDFLAQLEEFQKKLWLKKKFVVETSWCIRVGCIPEEFFPEIVANEAQVAEWIRLYAIDEIEGDMAAIGFSTPLDPGFLNVHTSLMVDTQFFTGEFSERLLDAIGDIDGKTDCILFHSENFQAINVMQKRYEGRVNCVYIDPPYNAQSSEILYKNDYKHSSWMSLIQDRALASLRMLQDTFVYITAIDEVENARLEMLYRDIWPHANHVAISVVHNPTGQQGNNFSFTHEFAHFVFPDGTTPIGFEDRDDSDRAAEPDIRPLRNVSSGVNHYRESAANCFFPILVNDGRIIGFGSVCPNDFHPASANLIRDDGVIEVYPIDPAGRESKWVFARDTVESIENELTATFVPNKGIWDIIRKKSRFRYKSLWMDKRYSANSWGSVVLNNILPGNPFTYPKSIHLVRDCIDAGLGNATSGIVLDFFAGSGTTAHAVINLNRKDNGDRKVILVEMGDYFDSVLLPRMKKVVFTSEWKDGKPKRQATPTEAERSPRIAKIIRLESYEDALNNLAIQLSEPQSDLLASADAQGEDGFNEQYMLRYMLHVETRGSQSLLNMGGFTDPTAYTLKVKRPGSDESSDVNVDLLETFNWLTGMTVSHIAAARTFDATFERNPEGRLKLRGALKQAKANGEGRFWFRTVNGTTPDGRRTLVIWRKLTGDAEEDNLVLDVWFEKQGYSSKDSEFDLIYVNGGNNLENLKTPDALWKVRLIEEDFHRLMFESETL